MRVLLSACPFILAILFPVEASSLSPEQTRAWLQYAQAAEAGWSAQKLEGARQKAEAIGSTAVMALFQGKVLAAWGDVSRRCQVHSIRKSIMNALIGIHVASGLIRLEKNLGQMQIDDLRPLTSGEKQATIRDLMCSCSGIYHPAAKETRDMKKLRPARSSHPRGAFWYYNNWDFNVLGAILEQEAEIKLTDEFNRRIALPLGMQDFRPHDIFWQYEHRLSRFPAYAFHLSARDLARIGQLYLQNGTWGGERILSAEWIRETWTPCMEVKPGSFYGYMWWIYPSRADAAKGAYPALKSQNLFAAWGLGGQLLLVIPGCELVFLHLTDTEAGAFVEGKKIWGLAELITASRTGPPKSNPRLIPLTAIPFKNAKKPAPEFKEIYLDPGLKSKYSGAYRLGRNRMMQITLYRTQLVAWLDNEEFDLFPASPNFFFARAENVQVIFNKDKKERISGLTLIYRGKPQKAKKI